MAHLNTHRIEQYQTDRRDQTEAAQRSLNAFRISIVTIMLMVPFGLYNLYVAYQAPTWQNYTHVALTTAVGAAAACSAWLSRTGRSGAGIWLLIGIYLSVLIIAPLTIAGLGPVLGLAAVLSTAGLAGVGLPKKQANLAIVISGVVGVLIILIDLYEPVARPAVVRPTFTIALILGIMLIYGIFVARQFKHYSLRTKLIIAFLVVSILSVAAVVFFNNRSTSAAIEEQVGNNLHNLADSLAVSIGGELLRQTDLLQSIAAGRPLQARLKLANVAGFKPGILQEIQEEMLAKDEQWTEAADTDILIATVTANSFAHQFREFQARFPEHVELFVTDQYGGVLVATNRTSDFYQADEDWWQAAYNNGQGAIYIGDPEFDASTNTMAVNLAVPVYDNDTGKLLGVLRSTLTIDALTALLTEIKVGHSDLYITADKIITPDEIGLTPADPETLAQLATSLTGDYGRLDYEGVPSLVSRVPVRAITGQPVIDQLDWTVVVHQPLDIALAPVQAQTRLGLLVALGIVGFAAAGAIGMAQLLTGPISRLTGVATRVAAGDLLAKATVESNDEIGQLAEGFNRMTGQLRETIGTLELRVADRTRQLETVVELSQQLAGILELSDLMRQVVTLTKETFGYYHAHIYLLEEETLLMTEGYGEAGAEMKRQGHTIPLAAPRSLVARSAREGRVVTVENVRDDPEWLPNPLLPDTHAEMAVPVMLGREVVGVLDVQSDRIGGLTREDESALQVLANQVAIAVRNARLFAQTQDALYEAQRLQRLYTGEAWQKFAATQATTDYEFRQSNLPPLGKVPTPEAAAALEQGQTVDFRFPTGDFGFESGNGESAQDTQSEIENQKPTGQVSKMGTALATLLKLRNETIGVLGIHDENPDRRWSEEERALIEGVAEQMSLALENARLFDETGRRAGRERIIADVTRQVWASGELEQVMQTAAKQLGTILDASKVVVRLGTEDQLPVSSQADVSSEA